MTTDSKRHSGEGIFFTSRILDEFAAISDGKIFTHDKYEEVLGNISGLEEWNNDKGTMILMKLSNFSNKKLSEVFDTFANENGGFSKTRIPIKTSMKPTRYQEHKRRDCVIDLTNLKKWNWILRMLMI